MRSAKPFPLDSNILLEFIERMWNSGWLDEYSDEHFLIKAIENRLDDFIGKEQLIENNIPQYCFVDKDKNFDKTSFCYNFCLNFSAKMGALAAVFGEENIKRFIMDQMSAGKKKHYNEDTFFQALSEFSILSFLASRCEWEEVVYEPSVKAGVNNKNPEAKFIISLPPNTSVNNKEKVIVNVEVKSPAFPHDIHIDESIMIPTVLLTDQGRKEVQKFCEEEGVKYLHPRIKKLVDFINSATSKFEIPNNNELNLLYINWSYRDFPSNSFLEAAALLSNYDNGILSHPEIAEQMGVLSEAFKKISAVIVYTESLEGLMFSDFRHVWQERGAGPRFRLFTLNDNIKQNVFCDSREFVSKITGMNPCQPEERLALVDYKVKNADDLISREFFGELLKKILRINML